MKKLLLIILYVLITAAGIAQNQGSFMDNKKILIAYFSWGGCTKAIAEKIQSKIGGDLFRIETVEPYPLVFYEVVYGAAKKQYEEDIRPELKDNGDVSSYDIIFVGTPVWYYGITPAIKSFLSKNNFEGKTIVSFISHGGGGKYTIPEEMEKLAKGAKVLKPFVVYLAGDDQTDREIMNWIKDLK